MDVNTNLTVLTLAAVFAILSDRGNGHRSAARMHRLLAAHKGLFTPEVLLKYLDAAEIDINPEIEDDHDEAQELDEVVKEAQAKLPKQPSSPPAVETVVGTRDNDAKAEATEAVTDIAVDGFGNTQPGANDEQKEPGDATVNASSDEQGKPDAGTVETKQAEDPNAPKGAESETGQSGEQSADEDMEEVDDPESTAEAPKPKIKRRKIKATA